MLFNSLNYLLLLLPSLLLYWFIPWLKSRQFVLFIASVCFYLSWSKTFTFLLLLMVLLNWVAGFVLQRRKNSFVLGLIIAFNLGILCYFKYINFFLENFFLLYGYITHRVVNDAYLSVILPLGISFFVFEFISYHVDIYRKQIEPERNFIIFSLFVMFFPHLIAGPICRASSIFPQLKVVHSFSLKYISDGIFIFLCGLFLKIVIADNLSPVVNDIYSHVGAAKPVEVLFAAFLFSIVILCDFWGYSTMALGSAIMFGVRLPINFDLPYISTSLQEFWRRWHITLSMWLRDYLYISLGGSRKGSIITYRNLFLVMLLGGIWHGAGWCFLIWGAAHGAWLAVERFIAPKLQNFKIQWGRAFLGWLITFTFVTLAWIPFRLNNIELTYTAFGKLAEVSFKDLLTFHGYLPIAVYVFLFIALQYPINKNVNFVMTGGQLPLRYTLLTSFWLGLLIIIFGSTTVESFIYFQF